MQSRNHGWLVLGLFFCSGATALVYEVVWSKFLSQMFGSTVYAQTVVLAAFMGGLAVGNKLFGRWADRLSRPVQAYGLLEAAIGCYALLFPWLDRAADHLFVAVGSGIAERSGGLLALKALLAVALLFVPTVLMGGTLPLMAAWLQKLSADAGRRSARFYSVNSLGAVMGSALAGFWLVQHLGMVRTLQCTAAVNIFIGGLAFLLGRAVVAQPVTSDSLDVSTKLDGPSSAPRWAAGIVALTGGVSMGLEVLASRSLALIFGSSLQSFAIVLMAFILGIGLGSAWVASPKRRRLAPDGMVVLLLCAAALWVVFLVFNIERWVDFYRIARTGLGRTEVGYLYNLLITGGISLVVLGLPAAAIGAVLPLMIRAVSGEGRLLGAQVGALLTWNTLGAVVGSLTTGFVLMPLVGLRNAFAMLALFMSLAALFLAWQRGWRPGIQAGLLASVLAGGLFVFGGENWRHVMSSGMFRVWETRFEPRLMPIRKEHIEIQFYEDGPDASVSVEQVDGIIAPVMRGLRINGKPDAGTQLDVCTQKLVAHLPMLAKPDARDVFVLGLASGMTAGVLAEYPVTNIVIAENCDPVIKASHFFDDWNGHILADPRTKLRREDARTVLKLSSQRYDVIITQPSNPWFVGVGSVFSREYFQLAASRLKPGGIMAQWLHVYETQDDIVELVLRTFGSVFPNVEIWDTGSGDLILLGSLQPWPTGPEVFRKAFAIDAVAADMDMVSLHTPEAVMVRQLASQRTAFAIPGPGPIQSDGFPILEYAAPRAFFLSPNARMLDRFDERTRQQLLAPPEKLRVLKGLPENASRLAFSIYSTVNGELYGCLFGNPTSVNVPCIFPSPMQLPAPGASGSAVDQASTAFAAGQLEAAAQLVALARQQNPDDPQAAYLARVIGREHQPQSR